MALNKLPSYTYAATVMRVVDGDTLILNVKLGFDIAKTVRCRLARIRAPELKEPNGKIAKAIVEAITPIGQTVLLESKKIDKYGRSIGEIYANDENLVDKLLSKEPDIFTVY